MKPTAIAFRLGVVALAAFCTLGPRPAAASYPDKKTGPAAPALATEYFLGPGDKLRIDVYKDSQLSQSLQVRPDGKITLPLIGDLEASGRTPIELRDLIAGELKEYMTN